MPNLPDDQAIDLVFKAIARSEKLSAEWVLKGGNALKKVYQSPRASVDLDFTETQTISGEDEQTLQGFLAAFAGELDRSLAALLPGSGYEDFYVQSTQIQPPNVDFLRSRPAFQIKVGYSRRPDRARPYSDHVKLEISLNDVICEQQAHQVDGGQIRVCSLNDIIAEKLRSLIQQKQAIRDRSRPGDVFDIWFYHQHLPGLFDYEKISSFLEKKSAAKFDPSYLKKSTFLADPEVRAKAQDGFDELAATVSGVDFPSFGQAWDELLVVVGRLSIPD